MDNLNLVVVSVILIAVTVGLSLAVILILANLGAWFMKVAEGTVAFINVGDSVKSIVSNITGYKLSDTTDTEGRRWLVPIRNDDKKTFQDFLLRKLGIRYIGFLWPHTHRLYIDIRSKKHLLEGSMVPDNTPLKGRVVDSLKPDGTKDTTVVDSLLFVVPRPLYMDGVQLAGDNSRINLLLQPIYRQVVPITPAYHLKGDFFTQLDAALESVIVDFFARYRLTADDVVEPDDNGKPLTYSSWLKLSKAGGNSPLERHLRTINSSMVYRDSLEDRLKKYVDTLMEGNTLGSTPPPLASTAPHGIISRFGFALVSFRLVDWEPHTDTVDLAKALLAKQTEEHKAEGVREKAYGERDAKVANATGDSAFVNQVMAALKGHNVDANVAAGVLGTMVRTQNIGGSKITTYVEGGGSASVMVPASPSAPSAPTPNPPPTTPSV